MMDVDRRNDIIAPRGAPATEVELQAVSDWLVAVEKMKETE